VEIEKNVPVPPPRKEPNAGLTSLLRAMDVGDSIFAPGGQSACVIASSVGKAKGVKFTARKEGDGWRVWRLS